ncbi:MAG: hypothetical protein EKK49_14340 [Rhodocyclaceae bacterium]|nr:MAG: hypothetical protein EKK49_14340 [Rhodocyclaceae bacterium]
MCDFHIEGAMSVGFRGGFGRQGGAVLAVVLIILLVMMLGATSLLSSVGTSALLSGNIGFKRDTNSRSARGLGDAFKQMTGTNRTTLLSIQDSIVGCPPPASTGVKCTAATEWVKQNFYPRLLESDENGIPVIIKDATAFDSVFKVAAQSYTGGFAASDVTKTRFLIERMCTTYGPASAVTCMLSSNSPRGGTGWAGKPGSTATPLYRVTVRTDGVRNSQTYAQWIVTFAQE